jgi:hypothetical protein
MHKQTIQDVIDSLPDEIDVDQLLNQLYVLEKIEAGERALVEQGGVPHAEVEKRFAAIVVRRSPSDMRREDGKHLRSTCKTVSLPGGSSIVPVLTLD